MIVRNQKPSENRRATRRVGCRLQVMNDSRGMVIDISEGGARFSFHHAVTLQEDIDVPIKIEDRIIWARVRPMWAQPAAAPHTFDVGGSFTTISDEDREAIRVYVEKSLQPKTFSSRFHARAV